MVLWNFSFLILIHILINYVFINNSKNLNFALDIGCGTLNNIYSLKHLCKVHEKYTKYKYYDSFIIQENN